MDRQPDFDSVADHPEARDAAAAATPHTGMERAEQPDVDRSYEMEVLDDGIVVDNSDSDDDDDAFALFVKVDAADEEAEDAALADKERELQAELTHAEMRMQTLRTEMRRSVGRGSVLNPEEDEDSSSGSASGSAAEDDEVRAPSRGRLEEEDEEEEEEYEFEFDPEFDHIPSGHTIKVRAGKCSWCCCDTLSLICFITCTFCLTSSHPCTCTHSRARTHT